jgi:hypothetical protein
MVAYVDLNTIHNPATGFAPPAAWGDQVRDNDEYLYQRGPYICTAGTRPASPFEGQLIYETDTDKVYIYSGATWVQINALGAPASYTPTLTQSATVTKTINIANYTVLGKQVIGRFFMDITGSGTGANDIVVGLPVTARASSGNEPIGVGMVRDASANIKYRAMLVMASTTTVKFLTLHSTTDGYLGSTDMTAALASTDFVSGSFQYDAA